MNASSVHPHMEEKVLALNVVYWNGMQIGGAVMVEDTSLIFNAMNGLPGVYIKSFLDKLGLEGLNKMLTGFDDHTAYAQCLFGLTEGPGKEVQIFTGRCHVRT